MPEVQSSAIHRVEHDEDTAQLAVWFHWRGEPYVFQGVPRSLFEQFLRARSLGQFFNRRIRDRFTAG
ncbi:KTSC domain-containing protein [Roseomonas sp. BN140053]|uniref:KTSC domain-containing protein n=1 Tax=Roseomonas sp. BN140053 TaxID=3391898 RepID=UPI0039EA239B